MDSMDPKLVKKHKLTQFEESNHVEDWGSNKTKHIKKSKLEGNSKKITNMVLSKTVRSDMVDCVSNQISGPADEIEESSDYFEIMKELELLKKQNTL
jgi:hypothetical protein